MNYDFFSKYEYLKINKTFNKEKINILFNFMAEESLILKIKSYYDSYYIKIKMLLELLAFA